MVHHLFQELSARQGGGGGGGGGGGPPMCLMMEDTLLTSSEITMPQDRNVHGKVFGGWLMRRAFETAWAAGWRATGALPKFLALDDISFDHPVEVGTLVRFDARLDYSLGAGSKTYGVSVSTTMSRPHEAADAELRRGRLTNTFHFCFHVGDDIAVLPRVYPRTYAEAMQWIEAHRRMEVGRSLAERRKVEGARARFE
jgi:acyl-coenzyme A thioesterase 9